jgi:hypothetical protein
VERIRDSVGEIVAPSVRVALARMNARHKCSVSLILSVPLFPRDFLWRPLIPTSEFVAPKARGVNLASGHVCDPYKGTWNSLRSIELPRLENV